VKYATLELLDDYAPPASQPQGVSLKQMFRELEVPSGIDLRLQVLKDKLDRARSLKSGWDSYGAPAPNGLTIDRASEGLRISRLRRNLPSTVVASAEGGIALCWDSRSKHAYIEYTNDASVVLAMYDLRETLAVDELSPSIESIAEAINRVGRFITA
jgi:hypothetical protein